MPLTPGSRFGAYEIVAPLGAGAMGEVWRARDSRLSREVALKVLPASLAMDAERLQRFQREAQVLASLNHPNIAAIYGVEESGGMTALVLELVEGPTLDERIAQGAIPADEAAPMARQIAEALEYAHERGVVHRDLKPANVKLGADGRVKVLDFGLAKAMAPESAAGSASGVSPTITSLGTVAGVILGTAAYMAPEQARGTSVDRRADIWSFGVVLWEMLTGKRLFDDATVSDTLAAVLRAPIDWTQLPTATPPGLKRLLERCLERDPKRRLRDIGEARIALETLDLSPPAAAPAAIAAAPRRRPIVSIAWAAAVAVVALALVGMVGILRSPHVDNARVVRFQISPGDSAEVAAWNRLSPDGTMLAYRTADAGGKITIWVRRLDALEAQKLPETEGAARFWWSPDSRFVAFFVGGQLKKVPATGGPAQLICESDGADGAWGVTGEILFDSRAVDPIRGVDAAGGKPVQETSSDTVKGSVGQAWPFFLPDGKHYLFLAMPSSPNEKATIHVAAVGVKGSTPLTPTSSRVEYASGYLVYTLDGTLVAHRFDADTLKLSGDPIPLAAQVNADANASALFSTSSNGDLSYVSGASDESELVWVDRTGREIERVGEPALYRDIALSPDGTRVAYGLADPRRTAEDIWMRDLKRGIVTRIGFGPATSFWPVWSPDGAQIVYAKDTGGGVIGIAVREAAGAAAERILFLDKSAPSGPLDWSRDGKWLAVLVLPASRRTQVKMLAMPAGGTPGDYLVSDVTQSGARFSPDGRYVAYSSNEGGVREVYVQSYPAGAGKWQISSGGGAFPAWRSDGKELFFEAPGGQLFSVPVTLSPKFEPGVSKPLFKVSLERSTIAVAASRWAVSANGDRFLVNSTRARRGPPITVVLDWPSTISRK